MKKVEIIKTYYEENHKEGRADHEILGWESRQAQRKRFEILVLNVDLEGKSLLDVGCGLGNMLEFIEEKKINVRYTGVDLLDSMIECAKRKKLNGDFICTDIFKDDLFEKGSFDVIYSSGIFNINLGNNMDFLKKAVKRFLELSKNIAAFNLLHTASQDKEDKYYYYNPADVGSLISGAHDNISKINIIEGYLNNDFTVIIKK